MTPQVHLSDLDRLCRDSAFIAAIPKESRWDRLYFKVFRVHRRSVVARRLAMVREHERIIAYKFGPPFPPNPYTTKHALEQEDPRRDA